MWRFILLAVSLVVSGCAQVSQFSATANAVPGPNPAGNSEDYMYEVVNFGDVKVGYHLDHYRVGQIIGGYRITMMFINDSGETRNIEPFVQLLDANDVVIPPNSYEQFVGTIRSLGAAVSSYPPPQNGVVRFSGTATNTSTGSQYTYNGRAYYRENAGTSFARGADDVLVAAQQKAGKDLSQWGVENWLLSRYSLLPRTKTVGTVFFNTLSTRKHPMKIVISINGQSQTVQTK